MKMATKKVSKRANLLRLFALAVLLIVISAAGLYWHKGRSAAPSSFIDYSPATKEDLTYNDAIKSKLGEQETGTAPQTTDPGTSSGTTSSVAPVITAYGQPGGAGTEFRLNGFIPNIIESNGTCTLTLTMDSKTASASKAALQNAQNTSCGQLVIPYTELNSPGTWAAILSYSSPTSSGSSAAMKITIK